MSELATSLSTRESSRELSSCLLEKMRRVSSFEHVTYLIQWDSVGLHIRSSNNVVLKHSRRYLKILFIAIFRPAKTKQVKMRCSIQKRVLCVDSRGTFYNGHQ